MAGRRAPDRSTTTLVSLLLAVPMLAALPRAAAAQEPDTSRYGARPPDFLFTEPRTSLSLRVGMTFPREGSGIYSFVTDTLTLSRQDFYAPTVAADLGFRVAPRLDAVLSVGYGRSSKRSEFRNYYDPGPTGNDSLPIEQRTWMIQVPVTVGLKAYLLPRGRQVGRFAWIPTPVVPYVGAAGGLMWHRFEQQGDFVDYRDLAIYPGTYRSDGWSPLAQLFGGVDVGLTRHTAIKVEARYSWSSADMGPDFSSSFGNIDLAGLQTTVGLTWRY